MPTNTALKAALLNRLGVTPQRLSQRVVELKRDDGPMTTEDATYVLAHSEGIDLTKYLDGSSVDRIRGIVPRSSTVRMALKRTDGTSRAAAVRTRPAQLIRIGLGTPAIELMLSPSVADEAARMAELYPRMYLLENSIRAVISRVMIASHGADWWTGYAPSEVRKVVASRKAKEEAIPWHGRRGAHEIYYSDFSDLKNIINKNWRDFEPIIPKQQWIAQWLEELEPARNTIAHHNPVSEKEQKRIEVFFDDWSELIAAVKERIP